MGFQDGGWSDASAAATGVRYDLERKVAEVDRVNEELGVAIVKALERVEMLKTLVEVLCLKLNVDHDALTARAARRLEARMKVAEDMEREAAQKPEA